ncbi:MAG: DUF6062 family protein [Lachnospiraceae bacterium]
MKEKLYTIELNDALRADDECCLCWLERKLEQETLEFVLGSSYMESDIRGQTDEQGFCRQHTKMMYDYGNSLGNAWIFKSRLEYLNRSLKKVSLQYAPVKKSGVFGRRKADPSGAGVAGLIRAEEGHCYVCGRMAQVYRRMLDTFVYMIRNDQAFGDALVDSKGFCVHHFADVWQMCEDSMKEQEKAEWMPKLAQVMSRNLDRVQADIDWLIEKYDYRYKDADWKQSKDALQRTMQKISGSYPADPVFQYKK